LRLVGWSGRPFNAPELNAKDAAERERAQLARDRVHALTLDHFVYVESFRPSSNDKYGRWLLCVWVPLDEAGLGLGDVGTTKIIADDESAGVVCFDLAEQLVRENLGAWEM
jgi:hypothetical protein